jgi:hypothetical protein
MLMGSVKVFGSMAENDVVAEEGFAHIYNTRPSSATTSTWDVDV